MDPNEPFDYDRLDALLRDIGYEDPDELAGPQPSAPQQTPAQTPQRPAQAGGYENYYNYNDGSAPQTRPSQAAANTRPQTPEMRAAHQARRAAQAQPQQRPAQPQQPYRQQPGYQPPAQTYQQPRRSAPQPAPEMRRAAPPPPPPKKSRRAEPEPEPKKRRSEPDPEPQPKKKKKHRILKTLLVLLVLLIAAVAVLMLTNLGQPKAEAGLGARRSGCSTILLAGTDAGGTRTDTIMLCTINASERSVSLLSIPRDTLVNDSYSVPKINGTYGVYGAGEEGMEALMTAVEKLIGFRPDGYVLVDLDGFVDLVDLMGGVEFNVPVDMHYSDPTQDLNIDLSAGLQTLDGEQAMGVVRFRSGYALADLERVNVQRAFLSACMDQWLTAKNMLKAPRLLPVILENVTTDLSSGNLLWCAGALMRCDRSDIATDTLPGSAMYWNGGSYYVVSAYDTVSLINERYNPYTADVTIYDLDVRTP